MAGNKLGFKAKKGTLNLRVFGFSKEVRNFSAKFEKEAIAVLQRMAVNGEDVINGWEELVIRLFNSIKELTPVKTGTARAGWQLVISNRAGIIFAQIFNNVLYILFLEFGSSRQAPKGMVRISLDRFTRELRKLAR
jgi:hypothetical protein